MSSERYRIPTSMQARALSMHLTGSTARMIWMRLYPGGNGPGGEAAPRLDKFTQALRDLILLTEHDVKKLAEQERVPTNEEIEAASGDMDKIAQLALAPAVMETPLAQSEQEAINALSAVRGALTAEIKKCMEEPLPDVQTFEDGEGKKQSVVSKAWDPRSVRSGAVATLSNALAMNAATQLRYGEYRLKRTVTFHNLRLANKEDLEKMESEAGESGHEVVDKKPGSGFVIDMEGTKH